MIESFIKFGKQETGQLLPILTTVIIVVLLGRDVGLPLFFNLKVTTNESSFSYQSTRRPAL